MSRNNIKGYKREKYFICINCGFTVAGTGPGTFHRNHCPVCLYSRHVDFHTGDRMSVCRGIMEPIAICETSGELSIVHRCLECGTLRINRIAGDDSAGEILKIFMRVESALPVFAEEGGDLYVL